MFGRVKMVKLLLDRGANISMVTADGTNFLEGAIRAGHQDVCMEIIKHTRYAKLYSSFCCVNRP